MHPDYIPYSTHAIDEDDIQAVTACLRSGWLTGGALINEFEEKVAGFCGFDHGVALNSGTASLHACIRALSLRPGDEVILPTLSFAATANCIVYEGATPIFCDVLPDTLLVDPDKVKELITNSTKAIICVDYAGQLCDYYALKDICKYYRLSLIADKCHSLGAGNYTVNSLADFCVYSFHPVKHITTGEGGMVVSNNEQAIKHIKQFRNHCINKDPAQRYQHNEFEYDILELGWNYRITDIQCALGISQLTKLDKWISQRRQLALRYDSFFSSHPQITPLICEDITQHSYHLYVVKVPQRDTIFTAMRNKHIGVNVHYKPIHLFSFYRNKYATSERLCPIAEKEYTSILSLPLFPFLTYDQQDYVTKTLVETIDQL